MIMIEILRELVVTEDGTTIEEYDLICTMTGFRTRYIIHHLGDGYFQSTSFIV